MANDKLCIIKGQLNVYIDTNTSRHKRKLQVCLVTCLVAYCILQNYLISGKTTSDVIAPTVQYTMHSGQIIMLFVIIQSSS